MSVTSTFEAAFITLLTNLLNDPAFSIAWARAPQGAPVQGRKEVVLFYAPGGDRQYTHSGVSQEQGRRIQVSIYSVDPQDTKDASKAIHLVMDGWQGVLSDGSRIFAVVPGMQDIDYFDNEEKVFQTVFDWEVRMSEGS